MAPKNKKKHIVGSAATNSKKNPKQRIDVSSNNKIPKSANNEQTINGGHLSWRFSSADRTHKDWGWQNLAGVMLEQVIDKLRQFETMSWEDIIRGGSHEIPLYKLPKDAQKRLTELEKDDWDQIVSFRIGGTLRAWFLRDGNLMRALWWDPTHSVFPSKLNRKKHQ